jgi:hypothetical protein
VAKLPVSLGLAGGGRNTSMWLPMIAPPVSSASNQPPLIDW